ncbi:MAG: hypothetical protein HQM08_11570 [Candidatus Riflebacteria bacterium]|nr:hypothetical protein [Candidatus Riflebacteria bacterium]
MAFRSPRKLLEELEIVSVALVRRIGPVSADFPETYSCPEVKNYLSNPKNSNLQLPICKCVINGAN